MSLSESSPFAAPPTEADFWTWAATVPVISRDAGLGPIRPYGTQRVMVRAILDGLARGKHQFLFTKGGQVGGSVTAQLLTAWWMEHCAGLIGLCAANDDDVREDFRQKYSAMMRAVLNVDELPMDNQKAVELENKGHLMFMTAGPRSGARLSVGRGFALFHGTEMALWQNPQAFGIARTRFSDVHPMRLLIGETTPRGRNWWYDVWEEAKSMKDIVRAVLAWWMREDYALDPASEEYREYWDGRLTGRERMWIRIVTKRHGVTLRPTQLAWRRRYVATKMGGDEQLADQEMFTLPEEGFEATGISFIRDEAVRQCRRAVAAAPAPKRFRYEMGAHLEDTKVMRTTPDHSMLDVWEEPVAAQGYVVACVPAHSTTAECPDDVISVWKATRDTLEQVAEFAAEEFGQLPMAWVCAQLAGHYRAPRRSLICETVGFGGGVWQALRRLTTFGEGLRSLGNHHDLVNFMGGVRSYIWRRPDAMAPGSALHWKTNTENRGWILSRFRDQVASRVVTVRSRALVAEIERLRQDGDEFIPDGRHPSDHRVVAAALAVESWSRQLVPLFRRVQGTSRAEDVMTRTMEGFFRRLGQRAIVGAR